MDATARSLVHATAIAAGGRAALILGPSGAGKSSLALRAISHPFTDRGRPVPVTLVADDQVMIERRGDVLLASPPPALAGRLEVRGLGIVPVAHVSDVGVALVASLKPMSEIDRMPDPDARRTILGVDVPLVEIDPAQAGAPARLLLALVRIGTADAPLR